MGGGAAAAAAAAAKRRREQEEERMTAYARDDLEGWEFKIVRSIDNRFKRREKLERLCREEATAGWEMIEKLDNSRIRFKRRVDRRVADPQMPIDPYRTQVGLSELGLVAVIIGVMGAGIGLLFLFLEVWN